MADAWVSVKDLLPAHGEDVWLFSPAYSRIEMGWLNSNIGRWRIATDGAEWELRKVTHWKRIEKPAPPKETPMADAPLESLIDELERVGEAATKAPWEVREPGYGISGVAGPPQSQVNGNFWFYDAEFIVTARNRHAAILTALKASREKDAEIERLREWQHLAQSHQPYPAAFATVSQENARLESELASLRAERDELRSKVARLTAALGHSEQARLIAESRGGEW